MQTNLISVLKDVEILIERRQIELAVKEKIVNLKSKFDKYVVPLNKNKTFTEEAVWNDHRNEIYNFCIYEHDGVRISIGIEHKCRNVALSTYERIYVHVDGELVASGNIH